MAMMSTKLCDACTAVLARYSSGTLKIGANTAHHATWEDFLDAERDGCPVCRILLLRSRMEVTAADMGCEMDMWQLLRDVDNIQNLFTEATVLVAKGQYIRSYEATERTGKTESFMVLAFQLGIELRQNPPEGDGRPRRFGLADIVFSPAQDIRDFQVHYDHEDFTGSKKSLDMALEWYQNCVQSHPLCSKRHDAGWRPTRLIDLMSGGDDHLRPALRDASSEDYPGGVKYITMSHRWVMGAPLQLTTGNMRQLRVSIPYDGCKASIKDAMEIARHLGIRYLWVDSLCIVQDDASDKKTEISRMHLVYSNAQVNVAAADADNLDEGCFFTRDPALIRSVTVCMDINNMGTEEHCLTLTWEHSVGSPLRSSVLGRRGWVFQEFLLAPRILFCSRFQLTWSCEENEASENYPCTRPKTRVKSSGERESLKRLLHIPAAQLPYDTLVGSVIPMWYRVVEEYTRRGLTFQADRLHALDGVAAYFQQVNGGRYCQGLWDQTLLSDLLWRNIVLGEDRTEESQVPVASTWSWASVQGKIYYAQLPKNAVWLAEITKVDHRSFESSSIVSHESTKTTNLLRVRGRLLPVQRARDAQPKQGNLVAATNLIDSVKANMSSAHTPFAHSNTIPQNREEFRATFIMDFGREQQATRLFCLPIVGNGKAGGFEGLLLQQIHRWPHRVFRRVGTVTQYEWNSGIPHYALEQEISIE